MDKSNRNIKIQFQLPKQTQELLENIHEISKLNSYKMLSEQIDRINRTTREMSLKMAKAMQSANIIGQLNMAKIARANAVFSEQLIEQHKKAIENISYSRELATLSRNIMSSIQPSIAILENISNSIPKLATQSILDSIPKISFGQIDLNLESEFIDPEIQDLDNNFFQLLIESFEEKIESLPKGLVVAQGIKSKIDIILSILMLLFAVASYINSRETSIQEKILIKQREQTNNYLKSIENFTEKIYPQIESLIDEKNDKNIVIVQKISTLRISPSSKSDSVTTVFPNQLLDVYKEQKNWVYIKYFDHNELVPKMGWIYKGNVKNYSNPK